jgi:hypothetical protein
MRNLANAIDGVVAGGCVLICDLVGQMLHEFGKTCPGVGG